MIKKMLFKKAIALPQLKMDASRYICTMKYYSVAKKKKKEKLTP